MAGVKGKDTHYGVTDILEREERLSQFVATGLAFCIIIKSGCNRIYSDLYATKVKGKKFALSSSEPFVSPIPAGSMNRMRC